MSRTRTAIALCALTTGLISGAASGQMGGAALVRVAQAELRDIAPVTMVPGTVVSRHDARLSAEVEGRLTQVADVGTTVSAGEPVATIEDTSLRLQQAELEAEVARVEARLRFLESEEQRFEKLTASNLASATQLEETRSNRDVARSELAVARARLEQNADQIARTRILAPYDGVVVERMMTPGERVTEGSQVVRLVDQQTLEVISRAPLEYYPYVRRGQALTVRAADVTAEALVRTVVAVGDEFTHLFEIRMDLQAGVFPAGQTLRVTIPVSVSRKVLTVPRDALVLRSSGQSVFVVNDDGTARQVSVTVGVGQADYIEVFGDLQAGEPVVVRGNERLQPGQAVDIMAD